VTVFERPQSLHLNTEMVLVYFGGSYTERFHCILRHGWKILKRSRSFKTPLETLSTGIGKNLLALAVQNSTSAVTAYVTTGISRWQSDSNWRLVFVRPSLIIAFRQKVVGVCDAHIKRGGRKRLII